MATKRRGLGRGLDALLGAPRKEAISDEGTKESASVPQRARGAPASVITSLPVDLINRGRYQPRRDFNPESLQELADSITAQGVLQPIVVRPVENGHYEIIAGERRWRASQLAGLAEIPVVIREVDEQMVMAIGLIENIQRDNLNPLEEASAFNRLISDFGLTHQEVARAVGKSRTAVTNLLRLLNLAPEARNYLETGQIDMGHARALLGLKGVQQGEAARQVVSRGLSVRETEKLVRRFQLENEVEPALHDELERPQRPQKPEDDPDVRSLQDDLAERLGARVQIRQASSGGGKLVIVYNSLDELDGILAHIK